ncbi:hypothetical protein PS2_039719 [Malus domestica]
MPASARVVPDAYKGNSVNMVLDHSLVHDKESAARSLFSLPAHKKLKAACSPGQIFGYGFYLIAAFWDKQHIEKISFH